MRSFIIYTPNQALFRVSNQWWWYGWGTWHTWVWREMQFMFIVGKHEHKRKHHTGWHRCEDNMKIDFTETGWENIDWINLRTGTRGRFLWTWKWTFRFHKTNGTSRIPEKLLASQGPCPIKSVNLRAKMSRYFCAG